MKPTVLATVTPRQYHACCSLTSATNIDILLSSNTGDRTFGMNVMQGHAHFWSCESVYSWCCAKALRTENCCCHNDMRCLCNSCKGNGAWELTSARLMPERGCEGLTGCNPRPQDWISHRPLVTVHTQVVGPDISCFALCQHYMTNLQALASVIIDTWCMDWLQAQSMQNLVTGWLSERDCLKGTVWKGLSERGWVRKNLDAIRLVGWPKHCNLALSRSLTYISHTLW